MNLSIIIPAYNEEERIERTLRAYASFFKEDEIYVIVNGSKDNTLGVVKKMAEEYGNIRYENFEAAIGKGGAVIEGFKLAEKDLIGFVDADLCTSPEAFKDLVDNIGAYEGIIASRHIKDGKILVSQPWMRRASSRIFNLMVRILFFMNYKDTQCGAKLFKKEAIKQIAEEIVEKRWAFDVELLYLMKKNKLEVKEYPTIWSEPGDSRLNLKKVGPEMFTSLIKLRLRKFINN
jgi:glycosyltransferase involved in cell wall biosynthesis